MFSQHINRFCPVADKQIPRFSVSDFRRSMSQFFWAAMVILTLARQRNGPDPEPSSASACAQSLRHQKLVLMIQCALANRVRYNGPCFPIPFLVTKLMHRLPHDHFNKFSTCVNIITTFYGELTGTDIWPMREHPNLRAISSPSHL